MSPQSDSSSADRLDRFQKAILYMVNANRKASNKHKFLREWFKKEFDTEGRGNVMADENAVTNRLKEQFDHSPNHLVTVYEGNVNPESVKKHAIQRAYPGLQTVLLGRMVGGSGGTTTSFHPDILIEFGKSPVSAFYQATMLGLKIETIPPQFGNGAETNPKFELAQVIPESDDFAPLKLEVNWDAITGSEPNPCGLVSLGQFIVQARDALQSGKNIIFIGPPGTGKTELAICLCNTLSVPFTLSTATSDWTTFDTIGGYMPDPALAHAGPATALNFFPGIVLQAISERKWTIIDEVNRADVDKAFGELFTLLSGKQVTLPFKAQQSGKYVPVVVSEEGGVPGALNIQIPEQWRLLGTMNSFDKSSLFQLSFAFMRRFAFVYIDVPDPSTYAQLLDAEMVRFTTMPGLNPEAATSLADSLKKRLTALFASNADGGLRALRLPIGPAIPIDMLNYLFTKLSASPALISDTDLDTALVEGMEMYLFPQFEGQTQSHPKLVDAIALAAELTSSLRDRIERSLSLWTGYQSPTP